MPQRNKTLEGWMILIAFLLTLAWIWALAMMGVAIVRFVAAISLTTPQGYDVPAASEGQ